MGLFPLLPPFSEVEASLCLLLDGWCGSAGVGRKGATDMQLPWKVSLIVGEFLERCVLFDPAFLLHHQIASLL